VTSRTWSRPRSATPPSPWSSPRLGRGASRQPTTLGGGWNAICTTAPNSDSSRWASSCAPPSRRCHASSRGQGADRRRHNGFGRRLRGSTGDFRGIHPAIVSQGGLGPALEKLARRSAVPVRLDVAVERRLPRQVEVAAYYVVAEALTNTAKYAHASEIRVRAEAEGPNLRLSMRTTASVEPTWARGQD
jgi:hypothetical protein